MLSRPLASRALATTLTMSCGARNWPFLMFTGLPALATARMKSVWRQRKAGVCSTSTTAATAATSSSVCTSVSTGTPSWRFTWARMRKPSAMPRPRYDCAELRLALSYDDLKMNGTRSSAQISFNCPATSICSCSDSTTQGPAMRNSGRSRPTSKSHSLIGVIPRRRAAALRWRPMALPVGNGGRTPPASNPHRSITRLGDELRPRARRLAVGLARAARVRPGCRR